MNTKKNVLVTGGLGFIGSHTVVELANKGYNPIIIDNLSNSRLEVLDGIKDILGYPIRFENVDLRQENSVLDFFRKNSIDSIIHFAALKYVNQSIREPIEYYENNINGLLLLLKASKRYNINKFVFSSSCTVYGKPDKLPIDESCDIKPANSPYGHTKQIAEEILKSISKYEDLNTICLRYFNPIGAHKSSKIGELPLSTPENLVPYITQTAMGIRDCLSVYGDDYSTNDGSCIRDYIHVVDLANSHIKALERLDEKRNKNKFEVFNVGTGKGVSVFELIKAFEKVTGERLPFRVVGRREGDVEQIYADCKLSNSELSWKAKFTIENALTDAWNWQIAIKDKFF